MAFLEDNKFRIIWALMLVFLSYPVSWFFAFWWVLIIPFETAHPLIKTATEFLEKLISWPRLVGQAIIQGESTFPNPLV